MPDNRVLIITNSVYQLLTAIHMRRSILKDCQADILITDVTPVLETYLPRIQQTSLFHKVFFGATRELNQKCAKESPEELSKSFQNIDVTFRWILSEELPSYDAVYFANFDPFVRMLASYYYMSSCAFIGYEDGFSSYVIDYLREDRAAINRHPEARKIKDKVTGILLYEPHLAMRGDEIKNLPLPKINKDDIALRQLLNDIFDYKKQEEYTEFIFLEQSFRAENIKTNDIDLMRECQKIVGAGNFIVKPHPRNPENLPFLLGLTRKYPNSVPWELFLLNENIEDITILTVCSNAALTSRIVFGMDAKTVMLYELFQGKILWKEDDILKRYLQKFHRQFAGDNYYVPKTVYELRSTLRYLGGRNE